MNDWLFTGPEAPELIWKTPLPLLPPRVRGAPELMRLATPVPLVTPRLSVPPDTTTALVLAALLLAPFMLRMPPFTMVAPL